MTLSNQERSRRRKQQIGVWLRRVGEPFVIAVLAIPALHLAYDSFWGAFVADPFPPATRISGIWGMRLLVAGLTITPLARTTGLAGIIRFRRPIGLWAAAYSVGHFAIWSLDYGCDLVQRRHPLGRRAQLAAAALAGLSVGPAGALAHGDGRAPVRCGFHHHERGDRPGA